MDIKNAYNMFTAFIGRAVSYLSPLRPVYKYDLKEAARLAKEQNNPAAFYEAEHYAPPDWRAVGLWLLKLAVNIGIIVAVIYGIIYIFKQLFSRLLTKKR